MRNNYKHKRTGRIAEYDPLMGLWYVKGEEKTPIGFWQLEYSGDWEEIKQLLPPVNCDEPLFSLNDVRRAMLLVTNHPENIIGRQEDVLLHLKHMKQNGI